MVPTIGHTYVLFLKYHPESSSYTLMEPVSGFDLSTPEVRSLRPAEAGYSFGETRKLTPLTFTQAVHSSVMKGAAQVE